MHHRTTCLPKKMGGFWEKKTNTLETSTNILVQKDFQDSSQGVF